MKMDLPIFGQGGEVAEATSDWLGNTDPFDFGWWEDKEMAKKVARHYGWSIPQGQGTVAYKWTTGPGKEKTDKHLNEVIRPGIASFGSEIRELPDWGQLMEEKGIPPAMWESFAQNMVGHLSDSEKTGFGTMTPTSACRMGKNCPKCYAERLEAGMPNLTSNGWKHLNALASNPVLHGSAMAYLINNHPSPTFRWNIGGDYANVEHIAHTLSVAAATPGTQHWLHTKDGKTLLEYLDQYEPGSQEWHDAIPAPHTFLYSQPHARMTTGPTGGGQLGDETTASDRIAWGKLNQYADINNPMKHMGLTGTELGTEPRDDAFFCPSSLKVKDPETGKPIVPCTDFGCRACRTRGGPTVQFGGHSGAHGNQPIADKKGVEARAMSEQQYDEQTQRALGMVMDTKQRQEAAMRQLMEENQQ